MVKILDFRERNEKKELHLLWSSGMRMWCDFQETKTDWGDLVDPFMEQRQKTINEQQQQQEKKCTIKDHMADLTPGLSWVTEDNAAYCASGWELETNCLVCSCPFVSVGETIPKMRFKPTKRSPMHVCVNRCKLGCIVSVCDTCMTEARVELRAKNGSPPRKSRRSRMAN